MATINDVENRVEDVEGLLNKIAGESLARENKYRSKIKLATVAIISSCIVIVTAIVCFAYFSLQTIREQQYALNMQYGALMDYINNATITKGETGDNGIIVQGNDNNTAGGDING